MMVGQVSYQSIDGKSNMLCGCGYAAQENIWKSTVGLTPCVIGC
jgi:hypothetical protein